MVLHNVPFQLPICGTFVLHLDTQNVPLFGPYTADMTDERVLMQRGWIAFRPSQAPALALAVIAAARKTAAALRADGLLAHFEKVVRLCAALRAGDLRRWDQRGASVGRSEMTVAGDGGRLRRSFPSFQGAQVRDDGVSFFGIDFRRKLFGHVFEQ